MNGVSRASDEVPSAERAQLGLKRLLSSNILAVSEGLSRDTLANYSDSYTHRLHGSSFLWFIFRILEGNPKKELQWSPRVAL